MLFAAFYRFDNVFWLNWLAEGMSPEEIKAMQAQLCWLGVVAALGVGAFVGFINGVLVARIGIPSIIATLATAFVWRGMAVFLAGGKQFSLRDFNQTELWAVTTGRLFTGLFSSGIVLRKPDGIPIQAVVVLALAVLLWFILNRHRFGESLLFIGDNANVARVVGIDVRATRVKLFTLMGALAGLAGMFLTMETENFTTTQGQASLLVVIAAVFIGGTSIFGGSGTIVGSYIGLLIVVMLQIGMVAMGLGGDVADMVIGVVFILAVILHMLVERPERLKGLGFGNR
jgi:simple sugar transport system permease protein